MVNKTSEQFSPMGENDRHDRQGLPSALMTRDEAQRCANSIRAHLDGARVLILDLHERRGWKALGYGSWRECVVAEFGQSQSNLYRQLDAAKIERVVSPEQPIGAIPERSLRPLAGLPPETQKAAYDEAKAKAPNGRPTATQVKAAVERVVPPKPEPLPPVIAAAIEADPEPAEHPEVAARRRAGIIPEGVAVQVIPAERASEDVPEDATPNDDDIPDEDWLATCPAREKLSPICRKRFDADALAFRAVTPHRIKFVHATRAIIARSRKLTPGHTGRWIGRHLHYLNLRHPRHWVACYDCKDADGISTGTSPAIGQCPSCRGNGYAA